MITIQVEGLNNAEKYLKDKNSDVVKAIENALKQSGFFIKAEVVESIAGHRAEPVSVDTGRFKNSIVTTFPSNFSAEIISTVGYAKFLEYGTSRMLPRKHFKNTADRNKIKIKEYIEKEIKKSII